MRKMTLMLSVFLLSATHGQNIVSKGAIESGNLIVSEPKSDFCIESFTKDTLSKTNNPTDTLKTVDIDKVNVDDVVGIKTTKVQEDKMTADELVVKAAEKAGNVVAIGIASHYGWGDGFHGKKAANGEIFDRNELTSAVPTKGGKPKYPFGTKLKITNVTNGKTVIVRVTDTGPFGSKGRVLDLSYGAFKRIADPSSGLANVRVEKL